MGTSTEAVLSGMATPGFFQGTGMPDPGWWEALWPDPAAVLAACEVKPRTDVVDLCCGDGWFTFPLSKIARNVIAMDIDRKLLNAAKVRFDERGGAPNVTLIEADAYDLGKYVHAPVDHVFLANTFHGVPDRPRLTRAVRDVLKLGGAFAIVNWYPRPRAETTVLGQPRGPATELRMTPRQTIDVVETSGLAFREQSDVSPYHYAAIFYRT
jgi:ubiquinone/menaquinone biosynthesis C-methylase UbiE